MNDPSPFAGLSNTELAVTRTDFASNRTEMADVRTELARDRNRMAADRTMMAWIRTSLSMISFGFGIDRFFTYLKRTDTGTTVDRISEERVLGLSLITLGVFALLTASIGHWRTLKGIEQPKFRYLPRWSLSITVAILLAFIGLASYVPLITQGIKLKEIFTMDSQIIQNFASLTVFSILFTAGINFSFPELLKFWQQPLLIARSLLSVIVIFPALVLATLLVFKLPDPVANAFLFLAVCFGPPLLFKRAAMAGARFEYVAGMQVTMALLSAFITPLLLKLFEVSLPGQDFSVNTLQVAKQIATVQLLPLGIGLTIRTIWSELADEISPFLQTASNTLFAVFAVLAVVNSLDLLPKFGVFPFALMAILTTIGLVVGHLLGSSYDPDIQSGLAIMTIARNVGLALFIALLNGYKLAVPFILDALIVGIIIATPYSVWMKRKIASAQAAPPIDAATAS